MSIENLYKKISAKEDLNESESRELLFNLLDKDLDDDYIAKILDNLVQKGESTSEIVGFSSVLLEKATKFDLSNDCIDICGTGGSGLARFNISTLSAFVLSAGGVKVVKHGNKGSALPNGSFDLLEQLKCGFDFDANKTKEIFEKTNLSFLFARKIHPAMKKVAPARKMLGKRTIFNIVGPLSNPAKPNYQIIGTPDINLGKILIEALQKQKRLKSLVVIGEPGIDEISVSGKTTIFELDNNNIKEYDITPEQFGIESVNYDSIPKGDYRENEKLFLELISNNGPNSLLEMVCINSGAGFYCANKSKSILDGYEYSKELFSNGKVKSKFQEYQSISSTKE